ncbi:MAG: hypothetical protein HUK17_03275 [Bacteroidales bacterium]|nr:hypothetical protein [Bacteroidales bacterium]
MRRNILTLLLALLTLGATAQDGINMPYSQYGFGLGNLPYNNPLAASMGGSVITLAGNNFVNPYNPASYGSIETESFVFDMGFTFGITSLQDPSTTFTDGDGQLGYLSVGFPLTKWWKTALALVPLSDINYQSTSSDSLAGIPGGQVQTIYGGTGGVSRLLWGHAFNIIPNRLSIGVNANYYYGYLNRDISYLFSTGDTSVQYMNVTRQKLTMVKNFTFDMGLQYFQPLGKDYTFGMGLTVSTPQDLRVTDNALVRTFEVLTGSYYYCDTIFPASGESPEYESTMQLPLQVGIGLSLQKDNAWRIALDGSYGQWSGVKYQDANNLFGATAVDFGTNLKCNLGFQLIGDPGATHYLGRITYSAGVHYESGKLRLSLPQYGSAYCLNEWGCGVGATLPMRKGRSLLTLSASYSNFGTPDLLRQSTLLFGISVSTSESWFVKRKYN